MESPNFTTSIHPLAGIEEQLRIDLSGEIENMGKDETVAYDYLKSLVPVGRSLHTFDRVAPGDMEIYSGGDLLWSLKRDGIKPAGLEVMKEALTKLKDFRSPAHVPFPVPNSFTPGSNLLKFDERPIMKHHKPINLGGINYYKPLTKALPRPIKISDLEHAPHKDPRVIRHPQVHEFNLQEHARGPHLHAPHHKEHLNYAHIDFNPHLPRSREFPHLFDALSPIMAPANGPQNQPHNFKIDTPNSSPLDSKTQQGHYIPYDILHHRSPVYDLEHPQAQQRHNGVDTPENSPEVNKLHHSEHFTRLPVFHPEQLKSHQVAQKHNE